MALDPIDDNATHPLTLARYPELLPSYPNLYIAWTNREFNKDSLLARGEYDHPYFIPPSLRQGEPAPPRYSLCGH